METTEAKRVVARSEALGRVTSSLMPGGVMSAFDPWCGQRDRPALARIPPVITKGKGASLTDLDGNAYVDYISAHGAMILGHADERVVAAISKAASKGCGFGAPSEMSVRLAELIAGRLPSVDMVRLVNTPADALTEAVCLARQCTGRDGIATFEGYAYEHAISRHLPLEDTRPDPTLGARCVLPYNDSRAAERLLREQGTAIAAMVVEPVAVSTGLIPPARGFLKALRALCDAQGTLLIFDEAVTGFRVALGGASTVYDVTPDLTILGPIIGGGLPLAAYGGRKAVMKQATGPADPRLGGRPSPGAAGGRHALHGAGTCLPATSSRESMAPTRRLSPAAGNLLAMAAGIATLQATGEPGFYEALDAKSARLDEGLRGAAAAAGVPAYHTRVAGIVGMFFCDKPVTDAASARRCDSDLFARYNEAMLDRGVLLPPFPLSCIFLSSAHTDEDIDRTIEAAHQALSVAGPCGEE